MDQVWEPAPPERRGEGRRRSKWGQLPDEAYGAAANQSMTAFLSGLKNNLQETFLHPDSPARGRKHNGVMIQHPQEAHDHWKLQLQQHEKQFQRHQRRWQMQQEEWLEQSSNWQDQQEWQRAARRKGGKKPGKPNWTYLKQLQKTLTIDSPDEEEAAPAAYNAIHRSSPTQKMPEEVDDVYEQRRHRRRHNESQPEQPRWSHERRSRHKVRWSDVDPAWGEEQRDMEVREGLEEAQPLSRYDHVSPVVSPRFGRPESPASQGSTCSPPRRSPVFGSRRTPAEGNGEEIRYVQPWIDGMHSFSPSASTVATAMDSPRRSSYRREQQQQISRQQQAWSDGQQRRGKETLEEPDLDPAIPRRQRLLEMATHFQHTSESRKEDAERQAKWRSDLHHQLDEGLREALTHDLLEFQKEAFFGLRGLKVPKPELQVLEEGVEWREDTPGEEEPKADEEEAERLAIQEVGTSEQLEDGSDNVVGGPSKGEIVDVEEVEAEPFQPAAEEDVAVSEEPPETDEPLKEPQLEDTPDAEVEHAHRQQEQAEEETGASECQLVEAEPYSELEQLAAEGEVEGKGEDVEEDNLMLETTGNGDENTEEFAEPETTEEGYEVEEELHEEEATKQATAEDETVGGEPGEGINNEEAQECEEESRHVQEEPEAEKPLVTTNDLAATDQLTVEALRALSLGMLQPQPQRTWEQTVQGTSHLRWDVGMPSMFGGRALGIPPGFGHMHQGVGGEVVYGWLAGSPTLQPPLMTQATGFLPEPIRSADNSCNNSVASMSSSVPSDFQWWEPRKDPDVTNAASPPKAANEQVESELPAAEEQQERQSPSPPPASPEKDTKPEAEEKAQITGELCEKETKTALTERVEATPTEEVEPRSPTTAEAPASPNKIESAEPAHEHAPSNKIAEATSSPKAADFVASAPPAVEASSENMPEPAQEKAPLTPSKDIAAAEEASAAAKAAAAAATTAEAAALEAARAAAAATAALAAHTAAAAAAEKEAVKEQVSGSTLHFLSAQDLDQFQRLQRIRSEKAAAAKAAAAAGTTKITMSSPVESPTYSDTTDAVIKRSKEHEEEVILTPKPALPAPPPARAANGRPQLPASAAPTGRGVAHEPEAQQPRRHCPLKGAEAHSTQEQSDAAGQQKWQETLQQQLQQQLELQQQQQHLQRLQLEHLQQELARQKRTPDQTRRQPPKVRFSDEAVKNEELKEQLKKQSKELRKLRQFRDLQQALHQETEQHLDTLHAELQKLADENVSLLQEQKQTGEAAQRIALQLLFLHALQEKRAEARQDAAVSPRNEQTAALEHVLHQNRELEKMQWQLQQLRHSVAASRATQHDDQQQLRALRESEARLQQENKDLKQMMEALRNGQTVLQEHLAQPETPVKVEAQMSTEECWNRAAPEQAEAFAAEQRARLEAEQQLRETLEVMQLLKQCLEEQKAQVASLEQQLEELKQKQDQQTLQQSQSLADPAQSTAILEVLERETAGEETHKPQQAASISTQTGRNARRSLRHASTDTTPVETTETGIQAGPPMPYGERIPKDAQQQQELLRQAALQQQLIARLKANLATQEKTFSQDKAYYQQLVLQLQQRIAELERYQHQLLLHVQEQQAMLLHSGAGASQYQAIMHQPAVPLEVPPAASAAAAALLQQVTAGAAALQEAARADAERQQQRKHENWQEEVNASSVGVATSPPQSQGNSEDWLKLLTDAIESEDGTQEKLPVAEAQQTRLGTSSDSTSTGQATSPPAQHPALKSTELSGEALTRSLPALADSPAPAPPGEHPAAASFANIGTESFRQSFQNEVQQTLIRQLQDSFEGKVYQHLEKLQRVLGTSTLQSSESSSARPLELPAPGAKTSNERAQQEATEPRSEGADCLLGEEDRLPGQGLQQALAKQEQQSAEQRLFLLLQQQHSSVHSTSSSPAFVSPVGTLDSVAIPAPDPGALELSRAQLKRHDVSRSPVTSTTASSVVADFNADEVSTGALFPHTHSKAYAADSDDRDIPGARQKVQQFRRLLRQQGLLT